MKIIKIVGGGEIRRFGQNTYLIADGEDAILIDGSASVNEVQKNLSMFNPKPKLKAIFLTHSHFDHIYQLSQLVEKFECVVYTNKFGQDILKDKDKNLSIFLKNPFEFKEKNCIRIFGDDEEICIGDIKVHCYLTPGHSLDSACFEIKGNMFTGDTIHKNCIGRVDLIGGDAHQMKISLQRLRNVLGKDIDTFYPGHGENFDNSILNSVVDYYVK